MVTDNSDLFLETVKILHQRDVIEGAKKIDPSQQELFERYILSIDIMILGLEQTPLAKTLMDKARKLTPKERLELLEEREPEEGKQY